MLDAIRSALRRFLPIRPAREAPLRLADEILDLLATGRASALREALKVAMGGGKLFPTDDLLAQARAAGWQPLELDKLVAYCEFFAGKSAVAYRRVMAGGLATSDYPLFMTACTYCYVHDRYAEGYSLLRQFDRSAIDPASLGEFLAFVGYLTFAAGMAVEEAVGYLDEAMDAQLYSPMLAINAYPIYFEAGRLDRVDQLRELIRERYSEDPEAIYSIACVELARDYYPEGFRLAEIRYRMAEVARSINPVLLGKARWQGESLDGKRLLVHGEQGFGDIIMMSRYLPMLVDKGVDVVLDTREAAIPLLAHNFPGCQFVPSAMGKPIPAQFDVWTGIMSLPFHFDTTAETVPASEGYLAPPPDQVRYWQRRVAELAGDGVPRIGLAWSGNPSHRADLRRSIRFDVLADHVRRIPSARFFCLQTSVPEMLPANLISVTDEMMTLADTAALIAAMDLVITVDTSIVHVAGALGCKAWLLLPYRYEWRWGLAGERNCWYDSVAVLRQKTNGDWQSLLADVFGQRLPAYLAQLGKEEASA